MSVVIRVIYRFPTIGVCACIHEENEYDIEIQRAVRQQENLEVFFTTTQESFTNGIKCL